MTKLRVVENKIEFVDTKLSHIKPDDLVLTHATLFIVHAIEIVKRPNSVNEDDVVNLQLIDVVAKQLCAVSFWRHCRPSLENTIQKVLVRE